jgi:hypothetical protein
MGDVMTDAPCWNAPATRRNKWVCALKTHLAEAKIFGPSGDPDAVPAPTRYMAVPWEAEKGKGASPEAPSTMITMPQMPFGGYNLMNRSTTTRKFPLPWIWGRGDLTFDLSGHSGRDGQNLRALDGGM